MEDPVYYATFRFLVQFNDYFIKSICDVIKTVLDYLTFFEKKKIYCLQCLIVCYCYFEQKIY